MTPDRAALLDRIDSFDIDGSDPVALPFTARLARENGWSRPYAKRVVREYKRYVFLAATSNEPACPSEDVDAAWHLHLTYTRSYWKRFCGEVLGRPLHHDPTKGGPAEADKHLRMYARTLAAYRDAFGHEPPADIWPPAATRFGDDLTHRVVNTARNWVIPKSPVKHVLRATAALVALGVFVPGCEGGRWNPFNLVGTEFLGFLIPMMIAAACVGRVMRSSMLKPAPDPSDDQLNLTWEQTAFLAGGYPRLTTAAIARLVERGVLRIEGDKLEVGGPTPEEAFTPVEEAVMLSAPISKTNLKPVQNAVEARFSETAAQMESEGFILSSGRQTSIGSAALMPMALVILGLAVPRLAMGVVNNKPVGFLIFAMFAGGILGSVFVLAGSLRLSSRGQNLLAAHQSRHAGLKTGAATDAALAVALFGTAALAGSAVADLQNWYPRRTDASSGGCGSGCGTSGGGCNGGGGGGGCGGGCGGCGGGGD